MSSLREIKDHIGSVRSTLKITSAMKLVASSKLRKSQNAIGALRPYEEALKAALAAVGKGPKTQQHIENGKPAKVAIVAIASNSSLCGGFNVNVIKKAVSEIKAASEDSVVEVFALGRKMAEALKKLGYVSDKDYSNLVAHPSYAETDELSKNLTQRFWDGEFSRIEIIYTHFISTSRQEAVVERYLPFDEQFTALENKADDDKYLIEPSADEIAEALAPQVLSLKLYAAVLDSAAAEHSARMIAMQTATDNGNDLLSSLTLEYNKGRQQKITAEILDLVGGMAG